jgi:hypothetical protein
MHAWRWPEPFDPVAKAAFFTITFGSGGGAAAFLAPACIAAGQPPLEPRTCSAVALLGACCPTEPLTEVPSP